MTDHRSGIWSDPYMKGQADEDPGGNNIFSKGRFQWKNLGSKSLEGKVKRSQLGWSKPHLSVPLLSTCIIVPEIGNDHNLQKAQVTTLHSKGKAF